jgi:hypothetical protein
MVRFVLAVLAGTVISFVIAFGACMLFPWSKAIAQPLPNDEVVMRAMYDNISEPGVYLFPAIAKEGKAPTMEDYTEWDKKAKTGPTGVVYFARNGVDTDSPMLLVRGVGIHLVASLLAAVMLSLAAPSLRSYFGRVAFVGSLGVFATLTVFGMVWITGFASLSCFLAHLANNTIAWLAAGLAMAALIRPTGSTPSA